MIYDHILSADPATQSNRGSDRRGTAARSQEPEAILLLVRSSREGVGARLSGAIRCLDRGGASALPPYTAWPSKSCGLPADRVPATRRAVQLSRLGDTINLVRGYEDKPHATKMTGIPVRL